MRGRAGRGRTCCVVGVVAVKGYNASRVIVTHQPDREFAAIPNSFIRCPHISVGASRVLVWMASQSREWDVYLSVMADQIGATRKTARRWVREAADTPYLTVRATGEKDTYGNPTHCYLVDLTAKCPACGPRVKSTRARGSKVPTIENQPENQGKDQNIRSSGMSAAPLPPAWTPNKFHRSAAQHHGLDLTEAVNQFVHAMQGKRRSDWDSTFGAYLNAIANGREEDTFPINIEELP